MPRRGPSTKASKTWGIRIPPLADEIALIERYGAKTLAVTLNGEHRTPEQLRADQDRFRAELGIPVVLPLEEGVEELVPLVREFVARERQR